MQNIKVLDYTRLQKKKTLFPLTAIQITILYKYSDYFLNHRFSISYGDKKARIKRAFVIYTSI